MPKKSKKVKKNNKVSKKEAKEKCEMMAKGSKDRMESCMRRMMGKM